MDKVYFKPEYPGCWWLTELTDIFYFKTKNIITNEEKDFIFSWSRNSDLSECQDTPVRRYDVEIDLVKYYFLVYAKDGEWIVKPEDIFEIEKLGKDKNILFVGTCLNEVQ